jgi:NADH-quinone oxidoreductase subunit N
MEFFNWINVIFSYNATVFLIAISILSSLCFGVVVSSSEAFAFSSVLNALVLFSSFFLTLLFLLFGCDPCSIDFGGYFFSQSFQSLFLLASIMVFLTTRDYLKARKATKFEYEILLSFVVLSGICLCFADDFLLIYLAIELQSLCLYTFSTFNRNSEFSTESGLKYFVFGAIISCFLLLGFSLIYLSFGSTSFEFLLCLTLSSSNSFLFIGILFILISFLFKVGAAPFHS